MPELREAAKILRMVAAERRLVELDKLLGAPAAGRMRGLRFLERIGALQSLLLSSAPRERRRGISLPAPQRTCAAASLSSPASTPATPVSRGRSCFFRSVRREPKIFLEGGRPAGRSCGSRAGSSLCRLTGRGAARLRAATWPRSSASLPLSKQNPPPSSWRPATRARGSWPERPKESIRRPAALRRILKPARPLPFEEISSLLGLREGPELGRALDAFDLALASSEIRGPRAARAWLRRPRRVFGRAAAPVEVK